MPRTNIVIDKSFLRGASCKKIHEIAKIHKILICDALTYECIKETPEERAKLFRKIPEFGTSCEYIPTVGNLIDFEIKNLKACGAPSQHIEPRDYSIHSKLCDENYVLPEVNITALTNKSRDFDKAKEFLLISVKNKFEAHSNKRLSQTAKQELEYRILTDLTYINKIIKRASELVDSKIPKGITFTANWVTFRFFQALELLSNDLFQRYESIETITNSSSVLEKVKHDLIDLNYFILATLEGGFATKEKKLALLNLYSY